METSKILKNWDNFEHNLNRKRALLVAYYATFTSGQKPTRAFSLPQTGNEVVIMQPRSQGLRCCCNSVDTGNDVGNYDVNYLVIKNSKLT